MLWGLLKLGIVRRIKIYEFYFAKHTNTWYVLQNKKDMAKNTSILLGGHFEEFISSEVASGRYNSASEVVRSALRLLELEEEKIMQLRHELELGEQSGFVSDFNPKKFLAKLHKKTSEKIKAGL